MCVLGTSSLRALTWRAALDDSDIQILKTYVCLSHPFNPLSFSFVPRVKDRMRRVSRKLTQISRRSRSVLMRNLVSTLTMHAASF